MKRLLLVVVATVLLGGGAFAIAADQTVTVTANSPNCAQDGGEATACSSTYTVAPGHALTLTAPSTTSSTSSTSSSSNSVLLGDQTVYQADSNQDGNAQAWPYTVTATGTVSDIQLYVDSSNTAPTITVGLYTDSSGHPGTLLTSGHITPTKDAWNAIAVSSANVTAGAHVWLAVLGTGAGTAAFRDKTAGTCSTVGSSQTNLTALSATWSNGWNVAGYCPVSFYAEGSSSSSTTTTTTTTPTTTTSSTTTTTPSGSCPASTPNTPGGSDPFGGCFPGSSNTGVPAGTTLTTIGSSGTGWTWGGGLFINDCGVTLNAVKIPGIVVVNSSASNGTHSPSTPCVTITNSEIDGWVQVRSTDGSDPGGPLVLTNDTVNVPNGETDRSPVLSANYYATGLNVEGGRLGFSCRGYCSITDSYVHAGFLTGSFHYNAVGSNGLSGPLVLRHNSLACDFANNDQTAINNGAGCSDDVGLFGDFGPISNVTIDKNLFVSDAQAYGGVPFCLDGGGQTGKQFPTFSNETVTNNVFQRGVPPGNGGSNHCGLFGPLYNWISGNGNMWSGNTWNDGTPLNEG